MSKTLQLSMKGDLLLKKTAVSEHSCSSQTLIQLSYSDQTN